MNVEESRLFWPYIVSMVGVGLLVGWSINLAADIFPLTRFQTAQPTQCCHTHQRAITPAEMRFFSYLLDRVGCRYRQSLLSQVIPVVELGMGFLFGLFTYHFGASLATAVLLVYLSVLLLISKIDIDYRLVPNTVVYPGTALVLLLFPISPMALGRGTGELYLNSVEGAVAGFLILLFIYLVFPRGVGAGDVKLGALIGAATGFPLVLASLTLAFVIGGVAALLLMSLKVRTLKDYMSYAPCLAGAATVSLLLGENIFEWHMAPFKGLLLQ